jgi:hypothetical protein
MDYTFSRESNSICMLIVAYWNTEHVYVMIVVRRIRISKCISSLGTRDTREKVLRSSCKLIYFLVDHYETNSMHIQCVTFTSNLRGQHMLHFALTAYIIAAHLPVFCHEVRWYGMKYLWENFVVCFPLSNSWCSARWLRHYSLIYRP